MGSDISIDIRLFRLPEHLQPYFTALYSFSVRCDEGIIVRDLLHPEWAAMRFTQCGDPPLAAIVPEPIQPTWRFVASGPTSKAINFGLRQSTIWGLGLHPLGWARYIQRPAVDLVDTLVDGGKHEAFALFAPLADVIGSGEQDKSETAGRIIAFLQSLDVEKSPVEKQLLVCQETLRDPEIADVGHCAEALGLGRRKLERMCRRHFGFAPKMLLRRQRFLRSLARFMLEPKHNWSKALDGQYFDQPHFVREFRSFMGMTPSEYADRPRPILDLIMAERMAEQGVVPTTDMPTVLRYAAQLAEAD